jgi:coenzyme F420-0:L-glutamate ligase/coenzyme F420-1:gamma-L-glutamate ligase
MNTPAAPARFVAAEPVTARFTALTGVPLIAAGDELAPVIVAALAASGEQLRDGDILIVAQKIVSKAEGRLVRLAGVTPSPQAQELARKVNKDARLVELILQESTEVVRYRRDVLVVAHRLGFIMANAGIDMSNIEHGAADETALLLPLDPDASCARLRAALKTTSGADVAVIINDSHGRAFRNGTVGVAIGVSGVAALADLRGRPDLFRRQLRHTEVGIADEIAAAASLLMGQAGEGRPIVLARGLAWLRRDGSAGELVRAKELDLFRAPAVTPPSNLEFAAGLFSGRRSIRRYAAEPVPDAVIEEVLFAATCAPSAHNRQPWRFALLKDAAAKQRLAEAMGERLRTDRRRDGDAPAAIEADVARSVARITGAPAAVVVCITMQDMDIYRDRQRATAEYQMAVQSAAMAMQNMLLAAHAAGLGASVMCAPLFCPNTVTMALDLPPEWQPQALVTLGYPASEGKPFRRRPLSDVVRVAAARS